MPCCNCSGWDGFHGFCLRGPSRQVEADLLARLATDRALRKEYDPT